MSEKAAKEKLALSQESLAAWKEMYDMLKRDGERVECYYRYSMFMHWTDIGFGIHSLW